MLLDTSGNGTKLRFDPTHQLTKSTQAQLLIFDDRVAGAVAWINALCSGIVFSATSADRKQHAARNTNGAPKDAA